MNDTDSLLVFRLQRLRAQPKTFRGRCILFYASLVERPCMRVVLYLSATLFILAHTLSFVIMIDGCYEDEQCSHTVQSVLWPLLLLSIYPIVLIPFIIYWLVKDIIVKKEGLMVWHRNSIGILIQRFFFSLVIMLSILTFKNCVGDSEEDLSTCLVHTGIPLVVILSIVTLKVLCLRQQRIFLWTGFVVCLIAQMLMLAFVDVEFESDAGSGASVDKLKTCLIFLPCICFGFMVDIQIIVSTFNYKPIAFEKLPFQHARTLMLVVAFTTLFMSIITFAFCLLVFGGINSDPDVRTMAFVCLIVKGMTWSPYLGHELYDTVFEQIYHDVQFQLNVIKPGGSNSRSQSPNNRGSKSATKKEKRLSPVQEIDGETLVEASEEENNRSGIKAMDGSSLLGDSAMLLKPQSGALTMSNTFAKEPVITSDNARFEQVRPVDFRSENEITDIANNRIVIQTVSGVAQSITDDASSSNDGIGFYKRKDLNLTEYERQVRQANGIESVTHSQVSPPENANSKAGLEETYPRFGSMPSNSETEAARNPNTWTQRPFQSQEKLVEGLSAPSQQIRTSSDSYLKSKSSSMRESQGVIEEDQVAFQAVEKNSTEATKTQPQALAFVAEVGSRHSPNASGNSTSKDHSGVSLNPGSMPVQEHVLGESNEGD